MANILGLDGAQAIKPVKSAPIYTGRWYSGIWTNRSPYRDATTSRIVEKFYGPAGDALIAGLNTEISNKLTLVRRPGNTSFGSNVYSNVDRFYSFRLFSATSEQINVMIDTANALYSRYNGVDTLIWAKQQGAGQSYMQSVGNSLYWGDGVSNKKWLQSLITWQPNFNWQNYPFLTTYLIDPNGNIQQLTQTILTVIGISVVSDILTVSVPASWNLNNIIEVGDQVTFPSGLNASFLDNKTVTVLTVNTNNFTANFIKDPAYVEAPENATAFVYPGDGTPISGPTTPLWSTTVPSSSNNFQGGVTYDGSACWTNRGNPVENWGIQPPTEVLTPTINGEIVGWVASTYYSTTGGIIDSNGNFQQVTVAGKSGGSTPNWGTSLGAITYDGTVTWTLTYSASMMEWNSNTTYATGSLIIEDSNVFQVSPVQVPYINGSVSSYQFNGGTGVFEATYPLSLGSAYATATGLTGFNFTTASPGINWLTINASGESIGITQPFPLTDNFSLVTTASITVPVAGSYTFTAVHKDGAIWGIGGGAILISATYSGSNPVGQTNTAVYNFPCFGGTNEAIGANDTSTDTYVVLFPTAGTYPVEIDFAYNDLAGIVYTLTCNGNVMAPTGASVSGSTEPIWPAWTTADAKYNGTYPNGVLVFPNVSEANGRIVWNNLGPAANFVWSDDTNFTLDNVVIVDPNGNIQAPYQSGVSGGTIPSFQTTQSDLTDDPNTSGLIWINEGAAGSLPNVGPLSTENGGWVYSMCLYNTLDNTASNATPISAATGNFEGAYSISIAPGDGIEDIENVDPQCDYVCIFRSTDGQVIPFLIPGDNDYSAPVTLPLYEYLENGYTDTTLDTGLNNLVEAPIQGQNTPPAPGAINLTYYLNRLWYSIGNTAYYTTGPSTPIGNGINGTAPLNYDGQSSLITRLVAVTSGMFVFSVSDIFYIGGNGTTSSPIQPSVPILPGIGLLSYNALDQNGSLIGLFTTDHQFILIDPANGVSSVSIPIADQLQLNNGTPGQSWNPATAYVSWYVNGQDQAWYLGDGQYGWYRLINTPAPETGYTWSPFARIVSGVKAIQNIEITPGVHNLLLGPSVSGQILYRDITNWQDNEQSYSAWSVLGSAVLSQPGQIAEVNFVTTKSTNTGTPLVVSVALDEALPYYSDSFDILKKWEWDPPTLPKSKSVYNQRFYLSEVKDESAVCTDMQIRIDWAAENFQNELHALTVFGGYIQES